MRYSLGCAFTLDEILETFPLKKLKSDCNKCKELYNDYHRHLLVRRIFKECFKLVINDIIENNITFHLPLTGTRKCYLCMDRTTGDAFKHYRQHGKWMDVDFLKSMFSGYWIGFYMMGNRTPRKKHIYVSRTLRDRITEKTNEGFNYGDNNNDKTIKDYHEQIFNMFPTIPKSDIKRILTYSWKVLYLHNSYGGDTIIKDQNFWSYIGNLKRNPIEHFRYYIRKLAIRIRVLYRKRKIQWDGYYYFGLTKNQYDKYLQQKKKRGRPRKNFVYGNVFLYQILDECKIRENGARYIFRVPYITHVKYSMYRANFESDKAELILVREPLKFKDIMVNDNEYELL